MSAISSESGPVVSATLLWLLITASAAFYVGALLAMKHWGALPAPMTLTIVLCMVLAAGFETLALRGERLGMVYAAILAVEVILLAAITTLVLGESFSIREVAGVGLIVAGTALAWT